MRMVRRNNMFIIQLQRADKCSPELGKKVKRSSKKGHMAPDRFSAGKTADGLVYHCLKNGGCQIFL